MQRREEVARKKVQRWRMLPDHVPQMGLATARTIWWVVSTKFEECSPPIDPWGDWTLRAGEYGDLVGRNGLQRQHIPEHEDVLRVRRWSWHV